MPERILVVDDHAPNRELIREVLTDSGYEIREAVTASEALECLRQHKTDLVITDVRMPGLSGFELLKRLNKDYPDVVVILMSAFATVAGAVEAIKLGAHDFLTQPLKIDELQSVIERALDRYGVGADRGSSTGPMERGPGFEDMLGHSKRLMAVLDQATRAARTSS